MILKKTTLILFQPSLPTLLLESLQEKRTTFILSSLFDRRSGGIREDLSDRVSRGYELSPSALSPD